MTSGLLGPRILVTGFGPFPGAPDNPTAALVRALAAEPPGAFGASAFRAAVLPTDYRKSWTALRRIYAGFSPDLVLHFGLSRRAEAMVVERFGSRRVHPDRPDAAGYAPQSGFARRSGPERLASNVPVGAIIGALREAGIPAELSDHAGGYVCDATLYRSLLAAPTDRLVGFVHVPGEGRGGFTRERLRQAAAIVLRSAVADGQTGRSSSWPALTVR